MLLLKPTFLKALIRSQFLRSSLTTADKKSVEIVFFVAISTP